MLLVASSQAVCEVQGMKCCMGVLCPRCRACESLWAQVSKRRGTAAPEHGSIPRFGNFYIPGPHFPLPWFLGGVLGFNSIPIGSHGCFFQTSAVARWAILRAPRGPPSRNTCRRPKDRPDPRESCLLARNTLIQHIKCLDVMFCSTHIMHICMYIKNVAARKRYDDTY